MTGICDWLAVSQGEMEKTKAGIWLNDEKLQTAAAKTVPARKASILRQRWSFLLTTCTFKLVKPNRRKKRKGEGHYVHRSTLCVSKKSRDQSNFCFVGKMLLSIVWKSGAAKRMKLLSQSFAVTSSPMQFFHVLVFKLSMQLKFKLRGRTKNQKIHSIKSLLNRLNGLLVFELLNCRFKNNLQ